MGRQSFDGPDGPARILHDEEMAFEVHSPLRNGYSANSKAEGTTDWTQLRRESTENNTISRLSTATAVLSVSSVALALTSVYLYWQLAAARSLNWLPELSQSQWLGLAQTNLTAINTGLDTGAFPIKVDLSRAACSGNGVWYAEDMNCSCFQCFTGPACQIAVPLYNCTFNAEAGTPLLFEEYWLAHPEAELRVRASEHIGYLGTPTRPRLEAAIRQLHALVGNIETEGREIVVGFGSSQVIVAAMYGLSDPDAGPTQVWADRPFYSAYPVQVGIVQSELFRWYNDTEGPLDPSLPTIEVLTAPNNPDGAMRTPIVPGGRVLWDHAYLWPHFTPITEKRTYGPEAVATFTLSKLTGHAGTRVGWAVVADKEVAERMNMYIAGTTNWAFDNQRRGALMLEHVLATEGEILKFAGRHMSLRWERLKKIFRDSPRFAIQELADEALCTWSGAVKSPSPPYLWLKCLQAQRDPDCLEALEAGGITGRPGPAFGMGPEYARLELLMRAEEFETMARKLETMTAR